MKKQIRIQSIAPTAFSTKIMASLPDNSRLQPAYSIPAPSLPSLSTPAPACLCEINIRYMTVVGIYSILDFKYHQYKDLCLGIASV